MTVLYPPLGGCWRERGGLTILVGLGAGIFGVPHCPQKTSSALNSLPQFGHFIDIPFISGLRCVPGEIFIKFTGSIITYLLHQDHKATQSSYICLISSIIPERSIYQLFEACDNSSQPFTFIMMISDDR